MKTAGYVLMLIGIFILIGNSNLFEPVNEQVPNVINDILTSLTGLIVGIAFVGVGMFFVTQSKKTHGKTKSGEEVPIYHGKKIVGYRRH